MENLFKSSTGEPIAPQFTETEVTAMLVAPSSAENPVTLVPRGATSQIQGQNMSRGYDLFTQVLLKENSPMQPLGLSNDYTAGSSQTMKTTERPVIPPPPLLLQSDAAVNSQRAWNPMWLQQNQFSAVDANGSPYYHNYMQYAPAYNPNYQSQVAVSTVYGDQIVDPVQFSRVEQPMASQMRQVAAANANKSTTHLLKATTGPEFPPEVPPPRTHFPNPYANQNAKAMVPSTEQAKALHNQAQNLLSGGRGRVERPWEATKFETGEGSSSKRPKHASSPPSGQGPNAGPALQGPSNATDNPRLLDLINSTGNNNREFVSNSLYDPAYEALGLPVDPHIRLFQALAARGEKGYRMYD